MLLRFGEIRISLTAVLISHLAEKRGKSCVVVSCNLIVDVILTVVLVFARLRKAADKRAIESVPVLFGNCKIIFPRSMSRSVMRIFRGIFTVFHNVALIIGINSEGIIYLLLVGFHVI